MTIGNLRRARTWAAGVTKASAATALAATLLAAPLAGGAHAAKTSISIDASAYPADWGWEGVGPLDPAASTGSWWSRYHIDFDNTPTPPTKTLQLRGGAVINDSGSDGPASVLPGDTFRIVHAEHGGTLAEATFPTQLRASSSAIGATSFEVQAAPGFHTAGASLYRRVARNTNTEIRTPNVFAWEKRVCADTYDHDADGGTPEIRDPDACPTFDDWEWEDYGNEWETPADVRPADPSEAELGDTEYWYLKLTVDETYAPSTRPTNAYELVSAGHVTSVTPSGVAGAFSVPMQPGDVLSIWQDTHTLANDTSFWTSFSAVVPVGTVPPPDVTAPVASKMEFGVPSITIGSFLKGGLRTFVTLDGPGKVKQTLLERQAKKSKKSKGKKKKPKAPVVVAEGSGEVTAPGGTAQISLKPSKKGKKFLKAQKGKSTKLTLLTTTTDAAGNTATSERVFTLKKGK